VTNRYDRDLLVLGGGSGGVRAARVCAELGAKVTLVEEGRLGGTCVNLGCIPKKLLAYASHYREDFEDARGFGWSVTGATFDWSVLLENRDREIARLNRVYGEVLEKAGVEIVRGRGVFRDANTLAVGERAISADKILIATGSHPIVPKIPGAELGITSDQAFGLRQLPKSIAIVGGGYIGVEFAGIFHGLGVEVHLVHKDEHILNAFDDDVRTFLETELRLQKIDLHLGCTAREIARAGDRLRVSLGDGSTLEVEAVMFAIGRRANVRDMGLEAIGIEHGLTGGIVADDDYRTTVPSVFAIGDVIDRIGLTPVALAEAMVFARKQFANVETSLDYELVPTAVFSSPPVAKVGLSEREAWHRGEVVKIFKTEFRPLKHTVSGRAARTMMKLVVCASTDRVFGVHMVGPDAPEIVQGLAVALKAGATKATFDATIGIHPTAAEEFVTLRTPLR
jgi:glutathione reductase (NADPH)